MKLRPFRPRHVCIKNLDFSTIYAIIEIMAEVSNDLIYEVLKSVQAQISVMREDMDSMEGRLTSIDTRLGVVHTDMAGMAERMDRLESRMGRVETRLNFGDEQQ